MIVYFDGKFLEDDKVVISPFDRGFQFSDGIYEVIRYYRHNFFELNSHLARLKNNLNELGIPYPFNSDLKSILDELIYVNYLSNNLATIYIQITRGYQFPRKHSFSEKLIPTVFIYAQKYPRNTNELENGVKVGIEEDIRWQRCNIKSTMLLANALSNQRAAKNGFAEIIWHRNGIITEGTHTNVCFAKNNVLITPPLSNYILPGITRKVVLELCAKLGIEIQERDIDVNELPGFDEAMLLGTTTEITPIIEIVGADANYIKPGPTCKLLQNEFSRMINSDWQKIKYKN